MQGRNTRHSQMAARRKIVMTAAGALLSVFSRTVLSSNTTRNSDSSADFSPNVRRKKVYVVHGYMASPQDHWFPWLKRRLAADGFDVEVLQMPTPDRPSATAWDKFLKARIVRHDLDTFFVAHSLGCISLLRHLLQEGKNNVGGMVLVSGFAEPLPGLPQLTEFVTGVGNLTVLSGRVTHRTVIAARDDSIVPYASSARLAQQLRADFVPVERGGHFLGSDGFTEFGLVYEHLVSMARSESRQ